MNANPFLPLSYQGKPSRRKFLIPLVALFSGCGHFQTMDNTDGKYTGKGDVYFLPKTQVIASVPMTMKITEAGPYVVFGPAMLAVAPANTETKYKFSVDQAGITTELIGVQDPELEFVAIDRKNPMVTRSRTMRWNSEGVLTSAEAMVHNRTAEFVVSTIEAGAKIAASGAKFSSGVPGKLSERRGLDALRKYMNYEDPPADPDKGDKRPENLDPLSEDGLRAGLDVLLEEGIGAEGQDPDGKDGYEDWKRYAASEGSRFWKMNNAAGQAKLFKKIMATGGFGADGDAITKNETRAKAILEFFTTKTTDKNWTGRFHWEPKKRCAGKTSGCLPDGVVLFSYSEADGLGKVGPTVESDAPLDDLRKPKTAGGADFQVALSLASQIPPGTDQWDAMRKGGGRRGWHYILPAQSKLTVSVKGNVVATKRVQIAQHGAVAFTPSTTGGPKVQANVKLDSVTGARTEATFGGDSFDPNLINRVGNAAASVLDADPAVASLKRRKEILQLKKDIDTLENPPAPAQ
jgi:hypothetical protein